MTSDVSWTVSPDFTLRLIDTYRSWDDAQTDLANATQSLDAARRKLEAVRQGNGAHAADAATLSGKLEGVQNTLRDLQKR